MIIKICHHHNLCLAVLRIKAQENEQVWILDVQQFAIIVIGEGWNFFA